MFEFIIVYVKINDVVLIIQDRVLNVLIRRFVFQDFKNEKPFYNIIFSVLFLSTNWQHAFHLLQHLGI